MHLGIVLKSFRVTPRQEEHVQLGRETFSSIPVFGHQNRTRNVEGQTAHLAGNIREKADYECRTQAAESRGTETTWHGCRLRSRGSSGFLSPKLAAVIAFPSDLVLALLQNP